MHTYKIITPIEEDISDTSEHDTKYLFDPMVLEGIGIKVNFGKEIEVLMSTYTSQKFQVFDEASHYISEVMLEPSDEDLIDILVTIPIYLTPKEGNSDWDVLD